ncbi:hypothetical protein DZJ_26460 [Dickeya ananatis]
MPGQVTRPAPVSGWCLLGGRRLLLIIPADDFQRGQYHLRLNVIVFQQHDEIDRQFDVWRFVFSAT